MKNKEIQYSDFSSKFKFIRSEKDYHLSQHLLMQMVSKSENKKRRVIVKKHHIIDLQELSSILNDYDILCKLHSENDFICNFIGYCLEETKSSSSINLIYDYHQNTLEEEIASMINKNQKFSQKDLDCLIISTLKGLATLQKYQFHHQCIQPSKILIEGKGTIGLTFRLLYTPYISSGVSEILENNLGIDQLNTYNLSLQQLQLLNKTQWQILEQRLTFIEKINIDKQSLGLLVLRLTKLNEYRNKMYFINQSSQWVWEKKCLTSKLEYLNQNFSKQFVKKVQFLLFEKKFYSFNQLPSFMMTKILSNANISTHSRISDTTIRQSRTKSNANSSPIRQKINSIFSEKIKKSYHQMYTSPFQPEEDSATKLKSCQYELIKAQIEKQYFERIDEFEERKQVKNQEQGYQYVGGFKNNNRHGYGICYYKEGDICAGRWSNDLISGIGVYLFRNCDLYRGQINRGIKQGKGKYIYSNGNYYEGDWKNDTKHGFGIFYNLQKNEKYEGNWRNGLKEGFGLFKWSNEDKFEGNFSQGLKHGQGVALKSNGTVINGVWSMDQLKGRSEVKFESGSTFNSQLILQKNSKTYYMVGLTEQSLFDGTKSSTEYKNSKRNGFSKINFGNGDIYEGSIVNDLFQGDGAYYYKDLGCWYKGKWKNGVQNGEGILQFQNGTKISCSWISGKPANMGKIYYQNGDYYEGGINKMGRNGKGIYHRSNGEKIFGVFKNGVLINSKKDSI